MLYLFQTDKGPFTNYVIGIWGGGGQSKYYRELMGGGGGVPPKNYELCYFPVKM